MIDVLAVSLVVGIVLAIAQIDQLMEIYERKRNETRGSLPDTRYRQLARWVRLWIGARPIGHARYTPTHASSTPKCRRIIRLALSNI